MLLPLSPSTRGMTDCRFLARMRPGALLVNAGRHAPGAIVHAYYMHVGTLCACLPSAALCGCQPPSLCTASLTARRFGYQRMTSLGHLP